MKLNIRTRQIGLLVTLLLVASAGSVRAQPLGAIKKPLAVAVASTNIAGPIRSSEIGIPLCGTKSSYLRVAPALGTSTTENSLTNITSSAGCITSLRMEAGDFVARTENGVRFRRTGEIDRQILAIVDDTDELIGQATVSGLVYGPDDFGAISSIRALDDPENGCPRMTPEQDPDPRWVHARVRNVFLQEGGVSQSVVLYAGGRLVRYTHSLLEGELHAGDCIALHDVKN